METSESKNTKLFEGAGYLLGSLITILTAIIVFIISENVVVSIAASVPIGTTMGILLEQKFEGKNLIVSSKGSRLLRGFVVLGIIILIIELYLFYFI